MINEGMTERGFELFVNTFETMCNVVDVNG